jgi:hypothetical protein
MQIVKFCSIVGEFKGDLWLRLIEFVFRNGNTRAMIDQWNETIRKQK